MVPPEVVVMVALIVVGALVPGSLVVIVASGVGTLAVGALVMGAEVGEGGVTSEGSAMRVVLVPVLAGVGAALALAVVVGLWVVVVATATARRAALEVAKGVAASSVGAPMAGVVALASERVYRS
jgi:hypothetical protein